MHKKYTEIKRETATEHTHTYENSDTHSETKKNKHTDTHTEQKKRIREKEITKI